MDYQIFGRKTYAEPLKFLRRLSAKPDELQAAAFAAHGREGWVELVALPQPDVITVIANNAAEVEKA